MSKRWLILVAIVAFAATAADAQGPGKIRHGGAVRESARQRPPAAATTPAVMAEHANGIRQLLTWRDSLGLSAEQISQLEVMQQQAREAHSQHMAAALKAHHEAEALRQRQPADRAAYEGKLREMAQHEAAAKREDDRWIARAQAHLTPAQRSRLRTLQSPATGPGKHNPPAGSPEHLHSH